MAETIAVKPEHVNSSKVYDFDCFEFEINNGDFQLELKKRIQNETVPEIFWTPRNAGHWVITRSEDINAILNKPEIFSSNGITIPRKSAEIPLMVPIEVDPPNHTKYRNLLAPFLSPKAVNILGDAARKLAIELIDGFKAKGECEFIGDFATHLPVAIFMQIAGLPPEDRIEIQGLCETAIRGPDLETRSAANRKIAAYGMQKIKERRGKEGTDLISAVANAIIDGEPMSDTTLTGMVTLLLLAGLDTVASSMGFAARHLATHPEDRKMLVEDPSLINTAVEEMLRRYPIVSPARTVKSDYDYKDIKFKAGDMILVPTPLAGIDQRAWENPDVVDFNRKNNALHATFGGGVHRCMGSMLARVELRVFLEEWLKRIPDFKVKDGHEVKVNVRQVAMIDALPLVWKV